VKFSLAGFAEWNGSPTQRFRGGAGFLSNKVVEALDECKVVVDLTLEPVVGWPVSVTEVPSGVDSSPYIGTYPDCLSAPERAYRPTRKDFRMPRRMYGHNLILIPMSTHTPSPWRPRWKRLLRLGLNPQARRVLYLSVPWPSSRYYWDLASRQMNSMRRPYLSIALRTDGPNSVPLANTRKILDGLIEHPLVEQLEFLDPLDVAPRLI